MSTPRPRQTRSTNTHKPPASFYSHTTTANGSIPKPPAYTDNRRLKGPPKPDVTSSIQTAPVDPRVHPQYDKEHAWKTTPPRSRFPYAPPHSDAPKEIAVVSKQLGRTDADSSVSQSEHHEYYQALETENGRLKKQLQAMERSMQMMNNTQRERKSPLYDEEVAAKVKRYVKDVVFRKLKHVRTEHELARITVGSLGYEVAKQYNSDVTKYAGFWAIYKRDAKIALAQKRNLVSTSIKKAVSGKCVQRLQQIIFKQPYTHNVFNAMWNSNVKEQGCRIQRYNFR